MSGGVSSAELESYRPRLLALAYRMLGSAAEAEDAVQDAFLRWQSADRDRIATPIAWLTTVLTRVCLNRLTSARARRETSVGVWLPEPVLTSETEPSQHVERRESVSLGLLVVLERLTPVERAVFVLREAFAYPHRTISEIVGIMEANSQQVLRRARARIGDSRLRFTASAEQWRSFVERFLDAAVTGDRSRLESMLAAEATAWTDGGGTVPAARLPIHGAAKVARYLTGWMGRLRELPETIVVRPAIVEVNAQPAVAFLTDTHLLAIVAPEITDGRITAVRSVLNPDKLRYLANQLSRAALDDATLAELLAGIRQR